MGWQNSQNHIFSVFFLVAQPTHHHCSWCFSYQRHLIHCKEVDFHKLWWNDTYEIFLPVLKVKYDSIIRLFGVYLTRVSQKAYLRVNAIFHGFRNVIYLKTCISSLHEKLWESAWHRQRIKMPLKIQKSHTFFFLSDQLVFCLKCKITSKKRSLRISPDLMKISPAGTWCLYNVVSMSMQCRNVAIR